MKHAMQTLRSSTTKHLSIPLFPKTQTLNSFRRHLETHFLQSVFNSVKPMAPRKARIDSFRRRPTLNDYDGINVSLTYLLNVVACSLLRRYAR